MVTYEERLKAQEMVKRIEKKIKKDPLGTNKWYEKLPWWEKVDIFFHRLYNTYIDPIWYRLRMWDQRSTGRGYSGNEVWDFYHAHAEWAYPRLMELRRGKIGAPIKHWNKGDEEPTAYTEEEWSEILGKMCRAFWLVIHREEDFAMECDPLTYELIEEGMKLFAEHYLNLWD